MDTTVVTGLLKLADTLATLFANLATSPNLQAELDAAHAAGSTITSADVEAAVARMNDSGAALAAKIAASQVGSQVA